MTKDDAVHFHLQRFFQHIFLIAANDDGFFFHAEQRFSCGGHGNDDFSGKIFEDVLIIVDDTSFQGCEQIEYGNVLYVGFLDGIHIVLRNAAVGDHAEQRAVLVGDGSGMGTLDALQDFPCMADGHILAQKRWLIVVQILDLGADIGNAQGGIESEPFQQERRLVIDMSEPGRHIAVVSQCVAQVCVSHGGNNGVGVGVAVTTYISRVHGSSNSKNAGMEYSGRIIQIVIPRLISSFRRYGSFFRWRGWR